MRVFGIAKLLDKIPIEYFEYQDEFNCNSIYILERSLYVNRNSIILFCLI